jgi:hypothetical protein
MLCQRKHPFISVSEGLAFDARINVYSLFWKGQLTFTTVNVSSSWSLLALSVFVNLCFSFPFLSPLGPPLQGSTSACVKVSTNCFIIS